MDGFRCTEWKILRVVAEMNVFFVFLLFCGSILAGCRLGPTLKDGAFFNFLLPRCVSEKKIGGSKTFGDVKEAEGYFYNKGGELW